MGEWSVNFFIRFCVFEAYMYVFSPLITNETYGLASEAFGLGFEAFGLSSKAEVRASYYFLFLRRTCIF